MHENRILYTLEEYQEKLNRSAKKFSLLLKNKETGDSFFIKPNIKSMWLEKYRNNYLKPRKCKLSKALSSGKWDFLTLTYWTKKYSPKQVADRHKNDIKKFFRLLRKIKKDVQYTYFIEVTKNLYVHFHIFIESGFNLKLIRKIWRNITGSYIVDKKQISNNKMLIDYVNKYVNKIDTGSANVLNFMFENIDRFFGSSRKFFQYCGILKNKSLYTLINNIFIEDEFYDILNKEIKINKMLTGRDLTEIMLKNRFIFKIIYDEDGDLFIQIIKPYSTDDYIDFWKLYADLNLSSVTQIISDDYIEFYQEKNA